jgi:hypothetical protein
MPFADQREKKSWNSTVPLSSTDSTMGACGVKKNRLGGRVAGNAGLRCLGRG